MYYLVIFFPNLNIVSLIITPRNTICLYSLLEPIVGTRLIPPATNVAEETKARMLRARFVQTALRYKFRGDMTVIIL